MLALFLQYAVGVALVCGLGVVCFKAWQKRDSDPVRNAVLDQLPHDEDEHATMHELPDNDEYLRELAEVEEKLEKGNRQYGLRFPPE